MKLNYLLSVCFFSAMWLAAGAAVDAHPYHVIVQKNPFRLQSPIQLPIEPPRPTAMVKLQGTTTVLGRPQALVKLALPGNGSEVYTILEEGERAAGIEVMQIDSANRNVSVRNEGTKQVLFLEAGSPVTPTGIRR